MPSGQWVTWIWLGYNHHTASGCVTVADALAYLRYSSRPGPVPPDDDKEDCSVCVSRCGRRPAPRTRLIEFLDV